MVGRTSCPHGHWQGDAPPSSSLQEELTDVPERAQEGGAQSRGPWDQSQGRRWAEQRRQVLGDTWKQLDVTVPETRPGHQLTEAIQAPY